MAIAYDGDPIGEEARALVERHPRRAGAGRREVLVGGQSAVLADLLDSLGALLPWMALMVVGDDVRAAVPGLRLGRAAGQGAGDERAVARRVVRRAGLDLPGRQPVGFLDFTPTGFVEATQPILVLAIVFGLSMDYEVFLLSRIREQYDLTGDNTAAVATGAAAHRRHHHQRRAAAPRRDRRVLAVRASRSSR